MSYAVVRGKPFPAQLYLDGILDEILEAKGKALTVPERKNINLAQILYHCLKKNPTNVFMINGATGEVITNGQILKDSVSLARALIAKGARGKTVTLLMRNHQRMTAMYFAVLFAETLPFMQDPNTTAFEVKHYLKLIEPRFVFCDEEHKKIVRDSLEGIPDLETEVVVLEKEEQLKKFTEGYSNDEEDFEIPDKDPKSNVMMLPTSGSTGLPKAALMTEEGLIAQLPIPWMYHTDFPKPTELMMVLTTLQWMTFTMMVTSGIVMEVPLLISPKPTSVGSVKEMLLKYRPTWTFFGPAFVKTLLPEITADHFSSLKTVILLGSPATLELLAAIQDKLPESAQLCDGYGTTETQGFIAVPDREAPLKSNGKVFNIFHYKMVDENGKEVGLCHNGELYVKGISCIPGYYKGDSDVYGETFVDGWYKTGDLFYIDENERLAYLERIKFNFKYQGCHVAPEEVENVISSVPGVLQCVVCGSDAGPAAAVVARAGRVSDEQIHKAVNASLSEHKRLHGGIVFVSSLPHTHTGKLQRTECKKLIQKLMKRN